MFNKFLENKYPYLTNYFKNLYSDNSNKNIQSIIFYGSDFISQYFLAYSIARYLNCKGDKSEDCECISCRWLKENIHPAVKIVSKIDFKAEQDTSKTVISIKQAQLIKEELSNISNDHRVFILCDADIRIPKIYEKIIIDDYRNNGLFLPKKVNDKIWMPSGINSNILQDECANSLLKVIEEPPPNVTFFFLTEDKNDLISTIISRSQAFYVPGNLRKDYDTSFLDKVFSKYPEVNTDKLFVFSDYITGYMNENGFDIDDILDTIELYFFNMLKTNLDNKSLANKIYSDLKEIGVAKQKNKANIKPALVLEDLYLKL